MATLIRMPEVAAGADTALIAEWKKKKGDTLAQGDCVAEIETDKAVIELNAETSGVLGSILVEAGREIEVATPVAVLLDAGENEPDLSALLSEGKNTEIELQEEPDATISFPDSGTMSATAVRAAADGKRIFASPLAKRLAYDAGINLSELNGSGPHGRIVKRDVLAARAAKTVDTTPAAPPVQSVAGAPDADAYLEVPHTGMRRTIARRLTESKQTVPHFYLNTDCRMDALLELRKQINQTSSRKISVNDFMVKAVAAALSTTPEMNVSWTDAALRRYKAVDVSVAVSTETGLITPVLKSADTKSLSAISGEMADLAHRARDGKLSPSEYQGGSFTISNLGMYGVQEFSAIINPPQAAILAIGGVESRPAVINDELGIAQLMTVTLSVDHRAIDGALAAKWLGVFKAMVENPLSVLI